MVKNEQLYEESQKKETKVEKVGKIAPKKSNNSPKPRIENEKERCGFCNGKLKDRICKNSICRFFKRKQY